MRYYCSNENNQPVGPYSAEDLKRFRQQGAIADDTPVIAEGASEWVTYAALFLADTGGRTQAASPMIKDVSAAGARAPSKHTFISHASKDHLLAEQVCRVLEGHRLNCWIAPRDIDPGKPYDEEILRGIEQSKTFILLLSDAANASSHVKRELMVALRAGHAVYPIRIQEVEPGPKLEYLLEGIHWVDAWAPPIEAHLARLARLIAGGDPADDKARRAAGRKLTSGPLWRMQRSERIFLQVVVVLALLAMGWATYAWKADVISGIVRYLTQQVEARLGNASSHQPTSGGQTDVAGESKRKSLSGTRVNQTVVLGWALDRKAEKLFPSTEQIRNEARDVLGEISLKAGYVNDGGYVEPSRSVKFLFSDAKGKGDAEICRFKSDDPLGQTRTGKVGDVYLTGRVVDGTKTADGNVETIAVEILANSSAEATFDHPIEVALADVERKRAIIRAKEALAAAASQQGNAQVNQTLTLGYSADLKAEKLHPASDQVKDADGNVLGEVCVTRPYPWVMVNLGFVSPKGEKQLMTFRSDDPIGQIRVGKVEGLSFSSELTELSKNEGGHILTLTVKVSVKRP